jgi:hypothetical protein
MKNEKKTDIIAIAFIFMLAAVVAVSAMLSAAQYLIIMYYIGK